MCDGLPKAKLKAKTKGGDTNGSKVEGEGVDFFGSVLVTTNTTQDPNR